MSGGRTTHGRGGFSLIELLTTMVVIGILSAIAAPYLRGAIDRADARKIVSDVAAIRVGLMEYREEHDGLPGTADWGEIPPDLAPFLNNVDFTYKDVEYQVRTTDAHGRVDVFVRYPEQSPISEALLTFDRPGDDAGSMTWDRERMRFRLLEDNK